MLVSDKTVRFNTAENKGGASGGRLSWTERIGYGLGDMSYKYHFPVRKRLSAILLYRCGRDFACCHWHFVPCCAGAGCRF